MIQPKGILSQTFSTVYELRNIALAYFILFLALSILEDWYPDEFSVSAAFATIETMFNFLFCCRLIELNLSLKKTSVFGSFAVRFLILYSIIPYLSFELGSRFLDSLSAENPQDLVWACALSISVVLGILIPIYFFGTTLPAQILGIERGLIAAVRRACRQSSYFMKRFLGTFVPFLVLAVILAPETWIEGVNAMPLLPTGEVNPFSSILFLLSNFFGLAGEAVLMVIMTNVYLIDLRERGEIPAVGAEVFA